jgi:arginyl-tRNA synthetase
MYFKIIKQAKKILKEALKDLNLDIPSQINIEFPPNSNMGDLTTNLSFEFSKKLKKSPNEISQIIVEQINLKQIDSIFQKVESTGPYINFFINYEIFSKELLFSIDENYGNLKPRNLKIILEHTSANPNGPLHIGHIRNGILGDCLSRLLKKSGNNVETQYYVNDMGRQIAMVVFGFKELDLKINQESNEKLDHQIGHLYFKVNEALNENPQLKSKVDILIKEYEKGYNTDLNETFKKYVEYCLNGVKETLLKLNISHDKFIWEGQFIRNGDVDNVIDKLIASGYTKENEVLYLDLEERFSIEKELVLKRSDGTSLYSTRDLAYHIYKSQLGDVLIDVLGSDHKLTTAQLSAGLEILGEKVPEVIFYEFITLAEGSMSSRKGIFISADDLIDEAINRSKEELKVRRPELNQNEIAEIAEIMGIGAIRYYIAKLSPEKHIKFKWDEALSFEKGCISIQYAHARAYKLLKKANFNKDISIDDINNWTVNDSEIDLIRLLAKFPLVIKQSSKIYHVYPIAHYTQDLATAFNKFYKSQRVIGDENELARLLLVNKTMITIKNALNILGIKSPNVI